MQIKKNPKADLERLKVFFVEFGLIFTLGVALAAFEWKSYDDENAFAMYQIEAQVVDEDIMMKTEQKQPEPPKQEVAPPQQSQVLNVVENSVEVANELEFEEFDEEEANEEYVVEEVEEVKEEEVEEEIFEISEDQPEFPGGMEALYKFIGENMKYPETARNQEIQGKVYVAFVVEKNGSIGKVEILRGIGGGCDEEAMRVIKMLPKWKPGMQMGKAVRVRYKLPINFQLN